MRPRRRPSLLLVASVAGLAALSVLGIACSSSDDASTATTVALTGDAAKGETVVQDLGCTTCHTVDGGDGVGPTFEGLAGSKVKLADGSTVTADEEYLRTSITDPTKQVVDGFRPIMPERKLTDEQVAQVIAYLQAIGASKS